MSGWLAEPLVEKVIKATFPSIPTTFLAVITEASAISANCSEVGTGITEQSPNSKTSP